MSKVQFLDAVNKVVIFVLSTKSWKNQIAKSYVKATQLLTLALKGAAKTIGTQLEGKMLTVTGEVIDYKGKPEIIVTKPEQLNAQ